MLGCSEKKKVAGHIHGFLRRRPGLTIIVASVGAGGFLEWPENAKTHARGQPMVISASHSCILAALVNAGFAVSGYEAAICVLKLVEEEKRFIRSLKLLSRVLHKTKLSIIRCRIVRDPELQSAIKR